MSLLFVGRRGALFSAAALGAQFVTGLSGAPAAPPPVSQPDARVVPGADRPRDLKGLVLELSVKHPRLVMKARELAARLAEAKSRGRAYPDPRLGLAWTNAPYRKDWAYDDQRTPMTGFEYRLMQAVPFPGRLSTAAKLSDLDAQTKRLELAAEKNRLTRELLAGLVRTRLKRELLALTESYLPRMKITAYTARTRYSVGRGTLADVSRAELMLSLYEQRAVALRGELEEEARRLDYLLTPLAGPGSGPLTGPPGTQPKSDFASLIPLEHGLSAYMRKLDAVRTLDPQLLPRESVVVAMRDVLIARGQTERALAAYEYLPDMELFAAYRVRANISGDPVRGEDFVSFGVTFRVPLWSALSTPPLRDAKLAQTQAAQAARRDASLEVQAMFRELRARHERLGREIALYDERLVPQAESARDSARQAYETGKVDFEVLLMSWDTLYMREAELLRLRSLMNIQLLKMADIFNRILPEVKAPKEAPPTRAAGVRGGAP